MVDNLIGETITVLNYGDIVNKQEILHVYPPCGINKSLEISKRLISYDFDQFQNIIDKEFSTMSNISSWFISYKFGYYGQIQVCTGDSGYLTLLFLSAKELLNCLSIRLLWKDIIGLNFKLEFISTDKEWNTTVEFFTGYDFDSICISLDYRPEQIRFIACSDTYIGEKLFHQTLLSGFDTNIWIGLVACMFILILLSLNLIQYDFNPNSIRVFANNFLKNFEAVLKTL